MNELMQMVKIKDTIIDLIRIKYRYLIVKETLIFES